MCLADYAIGQSLFCAEHKINVGATSSLLVAANPNRALLIIGPPETDNVWLTTVQPASLGQGFFIGVGQAPIILDWQRHGNTCAKAWYAITVAGSDLVSVMEGEFDLARAKDFLRKLGA